MFDSIPHGWQEVKLSDVADARSSNVDKKTATNEVEVRLCNYTDVYYRNRITNDIKFMKASAKEREIERFTLELDDVIITKDSETPSDIAVPAYVSEELDNVVCGYHLTVLRPVKERLSGEFLSHLLNLPQVQHHFYLLANGITRFGLTADGIANAPLVLPPLPEQKKIAKILTSVNDVIEKTQAQIDKLKDLKTGMMQELLTRGVGIDGKPHTEFKGSPVGRIPKGWEVVALSKVLKSIDSGWSPACIEVPPQVGEWGVLKVSSVTRGKFMENQSKTLPDNLVPKERIRVKKGDLLLTRANGVAELVGKCVEVKEEPKSKLMMSDKILRLNPTVQIYSPYLLHVFNSSYVRKQIELCWGGSSGQKNISQADIKNLSIALPTFEEQKTIGDSISNVESMISAKQAKLSKIERVKKALMQDLLTGKIRVNVE